MQNCTQSLLVTLVLICYGLLTACGSSRSVVETRSSQTLKTRVLQVKEAPNQTGLQIPEDYRSAFAAQLDRALFNRKGFVHGTDGVTVTYRFSDGDAGGRGTRFWVGFGAGTGSIVVKAVWHDAAGTELVQSTHTGTVNGGATGGSWEEAFQRCATEMATFAYTTFRER